jgi:peroxiredoxin
MLTSCINDDEKDDRLDLVRTGDTVPEFTLTDADGNTVSSSSLRGKAYLLSFFDTGCPDCQKEFPVLQKIYDKYKEVLPILNVPRSQTIDEVRDYWDKNGLSMPVYTSSKQSLYYEFATSGIPRIYVVDGQGKVQAIFTDSPIADFDTLDAILQQLLKDSTVNLMIKLRVPTNDIEDNYFQNEYTISHLEVFFFDCATKKFVSKAVIDNLTQDEDKFDTKYDITYIIPSQRISVGIYDIFAIANYEHLPDNIDNQYEFLNMVDSITYSSGIVSYIPSPGPVMTSQATSMLGVDLIPWAGKNYTLTLEMERVLAKLQIGLSREYFELRHNGNKYADVKITNYKLVNLMKRYYLFQHTDYLLQLGDKPAFQIPDNFDEDHDQDNHYVVDPLFYQKRPNKTDALKLKDSYASWFGSYDTDNYASIAATNKYAHTYILENTSYKDSQKNAYSAGIVFKASVSPVFVYLYDHKTRTLIKEYRPEYWRDVIYLYNHNFYGSIQAVNIAGGLSLDELETYSDSQLKAYGIKQCKFNMGVYETYYTYWIQHRDSASDSMGSMKYGIVRNNFYKIVVTGVSGLGSSQIVPDIMRDNYPNSNVDIEVI